MDWIWIWVAVIAISLIMEFVTLEMVSIWTAIAGVIALILAACNVRIEVQLIVFFVIAIILLLSLRKVALKYLIKNTGEKFGTDSIIGLTRRLIEPITSESRGVVKINDLTWSVMTEDGSELPKDTLVEILRVEGNKLIVKEKKENK